MGLSGSSLLAVRGRNLVNKRYVWPLTALTIVATLLAMGVLPRVNIKLFGSVIGVVLILLAPTLFINKAALMPGERRRWAVAAGYAVYALLLFGNALFSSGLAALLFVPLMFLMGLSALEANATKRVVGLVQGVLTFAYVLPQGFVV